MRVEDLIKLLSKFDSKSNVMFNVSVESGRGSVMDGNCDLNEIEFKEVYQIRVSDEYLEENELIESDFLVKNVVVFELSGEEKDYD
jgi:hypothetical protein